MITGAADRLSDRISSIVYLDAFIPEDGQAQRDLIPVERQADADLLLVKEQGDGWKVPPRSAESFMVQSQEDRDWVDRRCVPHPYATMTQPISLTGALEKHPAQNIHKSRPLHDVPFWTVCRSRQKRPWLAV